jgi:hypothetical protein
MLARSLTDITSVSLEEWQHAIDGTDALEWEETIICYVEPARQQMMGEECTGWVSGSTTRLCDLVSLR